MCPQGLWRLAPLDSIIYNSSLFYDDTAIVLSLHHAHSTGMTGTIRHERLQSPVLDCLASFSLRCYHDNTLPISFSVASCRPLVQLSLVSNSVSNLVC